MTYQELTHALCGFHGTVEPDSDLRRTGDTYSLSIELPGVAKEAVKVTVEKGVLTVKAERKEPEGELVRGDRGYGPFEARYRVNDTLDADGLEAKLTDGVLTLTLRAKEGQAARIVPVC